MNKCFSAHFEDCKTYTLHMCCFAIPKLLKLYLQMSCFPTYNKSSLDFSVQQTRSVPKYQNVLDTLLQQLQDIV
jgi:hypothetical protein